MTVNAYQRFASSAAGSLLVFFVVSYDIGNKKQENVQQLSPLAKTELQTEANNTLAGQERKNKKILRGVSNSINRLQQKLEDF